MPNKSVLNPLSKKQSRKLNQNNKNLLESSSSDEERQHSAGTSALTPRPLRTTSAAKRQCLNDADEMEVELVQSTVSPSLPSLDVSPPVPENSAAAPAPTVANNGTPMISSSSDNTRSVTDVENQSASVPLHSSASLSMHANADLSDSQAMDDTSDY